MKKKNYNIGLLGFGTVGQGFYEIFTNKRPDGFHITRVAAKTPGKEREGLSTVLEFDALSIVNDPTIDILVEVINDEATAYKLIKKALLNGKHVVSANKQALAFNLPELLQIAADKKVNLLFEGAAGGVIPILQNLDNYLKYDDLLSIEGIVNGSSNYILTRLIQDGLSYDEALQQAQEKGFAELDPTSDTGGYDAAAKLSLIHSLAFRQYLPPQKITKIGIEKIGRDELEFAHRNELSIKQVARLSKQNGELRAYVMPSFVNENDPLFHVNDEFNGIKVIGKSGGEQLLTGKGAGRLPTGFAVYNDVLKLGEAKPIEITGTAEPSKNQEIELYLRRLKTSSAIERLGIELIKELSTDIYWVRLKLSHLDKLIRSNRLNGYVALEAGALNKVSLYTSNTLPLSYGTKPNTSSTESVSINT